MRPLATLALLFALVTGTGRALAAPLPPPDPPRGVVVPGSIVVTALPALPAGAYEFELFLVPDRGAPIRVSAESPAGAREIRWRMPAVAARSARLVLRVGAEGAEWESAPSAPFALAALPAGEAALLREGRSEAGVALESAAGAAAAGITDADDSPSITASASIPSADDDAFACAATGVAHRARHHATGGALCPRPRNSLTGGARPAQVPLRN